MGDGFHARLVLSLAQLSLKKMRLLVVCSRDLILLFYWLSLQYTYLLAYILLSIYSCFEKGCRKKCTRQSLKVLWVVLSALFSKEI